MRSILPDIAKVNTAAWGAIGVTRAGIIQMAELVHDVGSALLIIASLSYTIWKFRKDYKKRSAEED